MAPLMVSAFGGTMTFFLGVAILEIRPSMANLLQISKR